MKKACEFYVAVSPSGKYYYSYEIWIPEGEELRIEETDEIEFADEFDSFEDFNEFKSDVEKSRDLFKGRYTIAIGEFEPVQIKKFKKTYEEIR